MSAPLPDAADEIATYDSGYAWAIKANDVFVEDAVLCGASLVDGQMCIRPLDNSLHCPRHGQRKTFRRTAPASTALQRTSSVEKDELHEALLVAIQEAPGMPLLPWPALHEAARRARAALADLDRRPADAPAPRPAVRTGSFAARGGQQHLADEDGAA